jgi:hypothetical protein
LAKVKFKESIESVQNIGIPFNPKLDQASQSTKTGSSDEGAKKEPEMMYGPRDLTCSCCEMEINDGS